MKTLKEDSHDISVAPVPTQTLNVVRQTNGILRIHAENGGYLFSLVRKTDGKVYQFRDGFGTHAEPVEISY